jgi:hypothetical protein
MAQIPRTHAAAAAARFAGPRAWPRLIPSQACVSGLPTDTKGQPLKPAISPNNPPSRHDDSSSA